MKNFKLFERLWEHGRTLRRVGLVLVMCLMAILQVWASEELKGVYMTYDFNGSGSNYEYYSSDNKKSNPVVALGPLTTGTFKITAVYWKTKDNWYTEKINAYGWYNLGGGDTKFAEYDNYTGSNGDNCDCEHEIQNTAVNYTVATANTGNSGLFTFSHWWIVNFHYSGGYTPTYCSNGGDNYNFTYQILPPNATAITATPTGAISGSGTELDPYIVPYGGNLTIALSGSDKERADANSSVQYSIDGGSTWGTSSKTFSNVTETADVQNWVFKARCYNSTASLASPSETTKTVYYKAAKGVSLYKFQTKSSGLGTSNVGANSQTTSNALSVLVGGTLTGVGSSSNLRYHNDSYDFNGGASGYLQIGLDNKIKSGDVIRYRYNNSNTSTLSIQTTKGTTPNQISLPGNSKTTIQTVAITDAQATAFASLGTIYLVRTGGGTSYLDYFEILRPYVVTLDANTNGGKVGGNNTATMYFAAGEPQALPHATKSSNRFTGWFTTAGGSSEAANPYTATGNATLYAQFETCASIASGTVYKFQVKTGLTNGNTGITGTFDVNKSNYLSTLIGGTLTGYDKDGTKMGIQGNNAFKINDKSNAYLQVDLDCPIQAGDTIITTITNSGTTFYIAKPSASTTSVQDLSVGSNQKVVVPAGLVDESTLLLKVKDNSKTTCISSFEIKRPAKYTVSYNNGGGSGTMTSHSVVKGADQALTSNTFTKNGYTFSCWHANVAVKVGGSTISAGGDISDGATLQAISSDVTLTAQWTCTTPTFGTNLSATQVDYAKDDTPDDLTVAATANSGTVTYQWYSNDENNTTTPTVLDGETEATYTPSTATAGTTYYYCVATNTTDECSVSTTSNIAKIVVTDCTDVGISGQPSSVAKANVGSASTLTVTASGTNPTYQWYTCDSDGKNASAITTGTNPSGYQSATLSYSPSAVGTTYYKCVVSGDCGDPVTSNVVSITAKNAISPTLSYSSSVGVGNTLSPTLSGNTGSGTVTWVSSNDAIATVASDGTVTGVATGSVTITATIAATDSYWGNTAISGTITITDYTITYNCDGAESGCPSNVSHATALPNPLPSAPYKTGYTFDGWYTNSGKTTSAVAGASILANTTMYAKWTKVYASGSYSFDGNLSVGTDPSKTVTTSDAEYSAFRVDNIFFSDTKIQFEGTDGTPSGDKDDYKGWKIKAASTTVKFFVDGNSDVVVSIGSIGSSSSCKISYTDQSSVAQDNITISAGTALTYKVKAGTMVTLTMVADVDKKKSVTLKRIAISATATCTTSPTVTAGSNSSVEATTATVSCDDGISSLGSAGCEISDYGFVIATTTDPEIGGEGVTKHQVGTTYTTEDQPFSKNLTSLSAGTTYYVRPYATNGNGTSYGTQTSFTTQYAITTGSHENGSITVASSAASSASVNITATPNTGYEFTSWSIHKTGDTKTTVDPAASSASTSFTMPSYGVTVNATFAAINYAITHNAAENGTYTISVAGGAATSESTTANYGQTITLAATPSEHYKLSAWNVTKTVGGAPVDMATANTFTMPAEAVTIAPTFGRVYTVSFNKNGASSALPSPVEQSTIGGTVTMPSAPTYSGYTFQGWMIGDAIYAAGDATYVPTANVTALAIWKETCAGGSGSTYLVGYTNSSGTSPSSSAGYKALSVSGNWYTSTTPSFTDKTSTDGFTISATTASYYWEQGNKAFNASSSAAATIRTLKLGNSNDCTIRWTNSDVSFSKLKIIGRNTSDKNSSTLTVTNDDGTTTETFTFEAGSSSVQIKEVEMAFTSGSTKGVKITGGDKEINVLLELSSSGSCYYVTYDGNGATSGAVNDTKAYTEGDNSAFARANTFHRDDYEFSCWNTEADGSGTDYQEYDWFDVDDDMTLYAIWRIVIDENATNLDGYETPQYKDVRVTNGAMLTINKDVTVRNMLVETGSTLKIDEKDKDNGATLTVNSLSLAGGYGTVNNAIKYDMPRVFIDSKSTLTKTNSTVNFDIAVTNQYHPIAVPFRVKVKDVNYAKLSLKNEATYLTHYAIKTYDGENRAKGGGSSNWAAVYTIEKVDEEWVDTYLEPGRGYILAAMREAGYPFAVIRFPMEVDNAWTAGGEKGSATISAATVTKNEVAVTAWEKGGGAETPKKDKGWNILGVPFMSCFASSQAGHDQDNPYVMGKFNFSDGTYSEETYAYVSVPTHDFSEYVQEKVSDAVLLPGWCFFVQFDKTGTLTFAATGERQSSTLPIYAPKREQENMPIVETGIILNGNEASDKTTIIVSDRYSAADYEINADLEKMFGDNSYTLATYSLIGETRFAYNAMSNADAANIIPIGYRAPEDGEYTFSINPRYAENGAFESVNLIDYETGMVTDLLLYSYTFSTERTQLDTRFALNVVPRQETPTGIENGANGANDANGVRKLLINGQLFIILDGMMYDATGKAVK